MRQKHTAESVALLATKSGSIAEMVRILGLNPNGGMHAHLSKLIKKFGTDISHFDKNPARRNPHRSGNRNIRTPDMVLVLSAEGPREKTHVLRRCMIQVGTPYICCICSQPPMWNGSRLTLHIHHRVDNWRDNRIENVCFLCPNCHSQQPSSTSSFACIG